MGRWLAGAEINMDMNGGLDLVGHTAVTAAQIMLRPLGQKRDWAK